MDILNDLVWRSALLVIWIGNLLAAIFALLLVLLPHRAEQLSVVVNRRLSLHPLLSLANRSWRIERKVYRHHRATGLFIFACSAFVLDAFLLRKTGEAISLLVRPGLHHLLDAGIAFAVIFAVFGALLGAIVFFKPSLLRELEAAANTQLTLGRGPAFLFTACFWIDRFVSLRKRVAGVFIFICSSTVFLLLGNVLNGYAWRL